MKNYGLKRKCAIILTMALMASVFDLPVLAAEIPADIDRTEVEKSVDISEELTADEITDAAGETDISWKISDESEISEEEIFTPETEELSKESISETEALIDEDVSASYTEPQNNETVSNTYETVEYVDEYGTIRTMEYVQILDGTETTLYGGGYLVQGSLSYNRGLYMSGSVKLILADGAEMTIGTEDNPINESAISGYPYLYIYGQTEGTGSLNINVCNTDGDYDGISASLYSQYGGNVSVKTAGSGEHHGNAIYTNYPLYVYGGKLVAECDGENKAALYSDNVVSIHGGIVEASNPDFHGIYAKNPISLQFDYGHAGDHITASSYFSLITGSPEVWSSSAFIAYENGVADCIIQRNFSSHETDYYWERTSRINGKTLYPAYEVWPENEDIKIQCDEIFEVDSKYYVRPGFDLELSYEGAVPEDFQIGCFGIRSYGSSYNPSADFRYREISYWSSFDGTFTMPCEIISITKPTFVTGDAEYVDKDGVSRNIYDLPGGIKATLLDEIDTEYLYLEDGWYIVKGNVEKGMGINICGEANLILADGCSLDIGTIPEHLGYFQQYSQNGFYGGSNYYNTKPADKTFSIYGQEKQTGTVNIHSTDESIYIDGSLNIFGGNINCKSENKEGIKSGGEETVLRNALVSVNSLTDGINASGNIDIADDCKFTIKSKGDGIVADGSINIENGCEITINSQWDGIVAEAGISIKDGCEIELTTTKDEPKALYSRMGQVSINKCSNSRKNKITVSGNGTDIVYAVYAKTENNYHSGDQEHPYWYDPSWCNICGLETNGRIWACGYIDTDIYLRDSVVCCNKNYNNNNSYSYNERHVYTERGNYKIINSELSGSIEHQYTSNIYMKNSKFSGNIKGGNIKIEGCTFVADDTENHTIESGYGEMYLFRGNWYTTEISDSDIVGNYRIISSGGVTLSRNNIRNSGSGKIELYSYKGAWDAQTTPREMIISDCTISINGLIQNMNGDVLISNSKINLLENEVKYSYDEFDDDYIGTSLVASGLLDIRDGCEINIESSCGIYNGSDLSIENSSVSITSGSDNNWNFQGISINNDINIYDSKIFICNNKYEYEYDFHPGLVGIEGGNITINGCSEIMICDYDNNAAERDYITGLRGGTLTINGGRIICGRFHDGRIVADSVDGEDEYYRDVSIGGRKIILGWSRADDCIKSGGYYPYRYYINENEYELGTMCVAKGKRFMICNENGDTETVEGIIGSLNEEVTLSEDQVNALAGKTLRPFGYTVTVADGITHGVSATNIGGIDYYLYYNDAPGVLTTTVPSDGMKKIVTTSGTVKPTGTSGEFILTGLDDDATVSVENVTVTVDDISAQTYTGSGLTPALTVKDGENVLTEGVDYIVSYSNNIETGTATATVIGIGAYVGSVKKDFAIGNAAVTVKANDQRVEKGGTIGSGSDQVTATGLGEGHYIDEVTITSTQDTNTIGTYENALTASLVKIKDADGTDVTANYDISYTLGTLTVTRFIARIVDAPEAKTGLTYKGIGQDLLLAGTANGGTVNYSTDYDPKAGTGTWNADVPAESAVGSYEIFYKAKGNDDHEDSDVYGPISVSINKAALTVTAKDKTITYGDVPSDDGVRYSGFVNNETESVLSGTLEYEYDYSQYGDAGNHTITPKGLSSDNYDITYKSGTLTVERKEVTLTWSGTEKIYDGTEQKPAVTAGGLVNGDEVSVVVAGGKTNAGQNYTATATGITGNKAGNYKLPENRTTTYSIAKADHENKEATGTAKFGLSGTVELAGLMESGASLEIENEVSENSIFNGTPVIAGTKFNYSLKDDPANQGRKETVIVKVKDSDNYKDYAITVTVKIVDCEHTHTEIRGKKTATCTEKGYTGDIYCMECGNLVTSGSETDIDTNNHLYDMGVVTTEPTVSTEGIKTFTCKRCHHTYTEAVPKIVSKEIIGDIDTEDTKGKEGKSSVDVKTETKDNGSTETAVTIGGQEVSKTVKDENGNVTEAETKIWIGGLKESYTYTGAAIRPEFKVYDGTKMLRESVDYSLSYANNKNAGSTATITVKFKGNYSGGIKYNGQNKTSLTETFRIDPAVLGNDDTANAAASDLVIASTGKDQKPVPTVSWKETGKSINKSGFTYEYYKGEITDGSKLGAIKDEGTYKVLVKPKENNKNFMGTAQATITVMSGADKNKLMSKASVRFKTYTYTGKAIEPGTDTYTVKLGGQELEKGRHFTVTFSNNVEPGKATAVFTAVQGSGYYGSKTVNFTIAKGRKLLEEGAAGSDFKYEYSKAVPVAKGGAKPGVVVKDGSIILEEGIDYAVSYSRNTKVTDGATAVMTVKGKGKYKGSVKLYYSVTKQDIGVIVKNGGKISAEDKAESGKGFMKPAIKLTDLSGKNLKNGTDYEIVSYTVKGADGRSKGTVKVGEQSGITAEIGDIITVTVNGKGKNYTGSASTDYRYLKESAMLGKVKTKKLDSKSYNGYEVKLTAEDLAGKLYVIENGTEKPLVLGTDYIITGYSNNAKKGTAKVTLQGIGKFGGTRTLSFKITAKTGDCQGALVGGEWK